jgi:hypothetical protein
MDVSREIFCRIEQPQKSIPAHARRGFASPVARCYLLIPGPLIQGLDRLLDAGISDHEEAPALHIATAWRTDAGLQDLADQIVRHRVQLQPLH